MDLEAELIRLNAFVRCVPLPRCAEAVTIPNDDGTFDIYINNCLSACKQTAALKHELSHIKRDHFYNDVKEIETVEAEANLILVFN